MSSQTIREDSSSTIIESINSNNSRITESMGGDRAYNESGSYFRDYKIIRQLPTRSTEADIFIVSKDNVEYILKRYRFGIEPKQEILNEIKTLSENYPDNFIRVYESAFDSESKCYYEIQEYAQKGTLADIIESSKTYTDNGRAAFFTNVASQVGEALHNLHEANLLHLDVKPSNILLRSKKPLKMVLTDFGIATSLDSDMSKKFTNTRGTPMYQAPETYSGAMGRGADWWGLGMILLEIANGSHPFSDLDARIISNAIITKSVDIPEKIDEGQKKLIRGLLTRDTEKRWSWEQISRWLKGERDIPDYFEENTEAAPDIKPLNFMGEKYYSLEQIAAAFALDEEHWNRGKEFLLRGYVRQWMESNNEFEESIELDNFINSITNDDEKVLRFIYKFGKNLPFVMFGKAITVQNLFIFLTKKLKSENLTAGEQKIADLIINGEFTKFLNVYVETCGKSDQTAALEFVADLFFHRHNTLEFNVNFLEFIVNPQKYYCPFVQDTSSPESVIKSLSSENFVPMKLDDWNALNSEYILPAPLVEKTFIASDYEAALKEIDQMKQDNLLLTRKSNSEAERQEKEALSHTTSLEEYKQGVYKWVWGYSDEVIENMKAARSMLESMKSKAYDVGKAEIALCLDYLDVLNSRKFVLSDYDKSILKAAKNFDIYNDILLEQILQSLKVKKIDKPVKRYTENLEQEYCRKCADLQKLLRSYCQQGSHPDSYLNKDSTEHMLYYYLEHLSTFGNFTLPSIRKIVDGLTSSFNGDVSSIPNEIEQLLPSDLVYHIEREKQERPEREEREEREKRERQEREREENLSSIRIVVLVIAAFLIASGPVGWVILVVFLIWLGW